MLSNETTLYKRPNDRHRHLKQLLTVRPSTMHKVPTAQSAMKDPEMTMSNNSNEKTNGLINIKNMNEKKMCNT